MMRSKCIFKIILILSLCVMLLAIVSVFAGCVKFEYQFMYSDDQISKIELAILNGKFIEGESVGEITVLKEIADTDSFLNEFRKIEFNHYLPIGDPAGFEDMVDGVEIVLVTYANGDTEGINNYAQFKCKNGEPRSFGRCVACGKEDFYNLYNSWLNK